MVNQQKLNFAPKIKFPLKLKLVKNVGSSSLNLRSMFWAIVTELHGTSKRMGYTFYKDDLMASSLCISLVFPSNMLFLPVTNYDVKIYCKTITLSIGNIIQKHRQT